MTVLRILLIAPDPLARAALAAMLAEDERCHIIGRNDGTTDWSDLIELHEPDIILCDIGWQNSLTLPEVRELDVPVVGLVADSEAGNTVWRQGGMAIVGRDSSAEMILAALQAAYHGLLTFQPEYLPSMIGGGVDSAEITLPEPLTAREIDVLNLLAQGMTNRAIAHALQISDHTVKFHVNALLTKLNAQSRTEAAVKATRLGLLSI